MTICFPPIRLHFPQRKRGHGLPPGSQNFVCILKHPAQACSVAAAQGRQSKLRGVTFDRLQHHFLAAQMEKYVSPLLVSQSNRKKVTEF